MEQVLQRFLRKVDIVSGGCWLWNGNRYRNGYGQFRLSQPRRCMVLAHRFAYEQFVGPIPEGKELDHLCRVRHCVRPDHLEPVTRSENLLRSPLIGRTRNHDTCKNGHIWTPETTYIYRGHRSCRICRRAWAKPYQKALRTKRRGGVSANHNPDKTHCPQGHPYAGENLYIVPTTGGRRCLICFRATKHRAYLKRTGQIEKG